MFNNVRAKTPSSGLLGNAPSSGILKRSLDSFAYSQVANLELHLQTSNNSVLDVFSDPAPDGDPVQTWLDQSVNSRDVVVGVSPDYYNVGANTINLKPVVKFNDAAEYLIFNNAFGGDINGHFYMVVEFDTLNDGGCLFGFGETSHDLAFLSLDIVDVTGSKFLELHQSNFDTESIVRATTTALATGTPYLIEFISNSTNWSMRVNGVNQAKSVIGGTNNGDWLSDTLESNFCINRRHILTTITGHAMRVPLLLYYSGGVSALNQSKIEKKISRDYNFAIS